MILLGAGYVLNCTSSTAGVPSVKYSLSICPAVDSGVKETLIVT